MTPAVEPLPLRLPKDLLVLQPMQGNLDLEPVLLMPGLRCAIGSAEGCAVRLTKSDIVQPEHCVIEVTARKTMLTAWTPEATWVNDRLVVEPCELVPGDRVSLGPFDFRLRPASQDELLYAQWVEEETAETNHAEDVLRLRQISDLPSQPGQAEADLFSNLLRETGSSTDSDSHEPLMQHISKLIGDLQSQVLDLQDRKADLSEQLRRQHEMASLSDSSRNSTRSAAMPGSIQSEYAQVLRLLQSERDQLDQERVEFAEEQTRWQGQQIAWTQRLEALETPLRELDAQRSALLEEKEICRALAEELLRDKVRIEDWEAHLRQEERDLAAQRDELEYLGRAATESQIVPIRSETMPGPPVEMVSPIPRMEPVEERRPDQSWGDFEPTPIPSQSLQIFLTLIAFGVSAFFLGTELGHSEVTAAIGWTTALVGTISTLDVLLHRCWTSSR